jgi:hypothetical protein
MFPESETATNLNNLDYGGIDRPAGGPIRAGNFETSHTIMFAPFDIPDAIAGSATRFWINVTNRDIEADVISLSIVLWVGSGGRGELGVTPVVNAINPRSIDFDGVTESLQAIYDENSGEMGDTFSISIWVKPLDLSVLTSQSFFNLNPISGFFLNNQVFIRYAITPPNNSLEFRVFNFASFGTLSVVFTVVAPIVAGTSTIFTNGVNEWNLLTATWDRSLVADARLQLYMNGILFATGGSLTVTNSATGAPDIERNLSTSPFFTNYTVGIGDSFFFPPIRARLNMMGIWSSALAANEVTALYNAGLGGLIDWRVNTGNYISSANLAHYWLFGFDTTSNTTICNDYGNSSFALINLSDAAVDITVADDVVTDTPPVE